MKPLYLDPHTNNEKGQTLIAIVSLGVIALLLGVTISTRFIKSTKMQLKYDESTKALGMADLGIERFLLIPNETLENYISYGNCGADCDFSITDETGQVLTAHINLSFAGNSEDSFEINVEGGDVYQLSLTGYPSNNTFDVCWNGDAAIYASYVYELSGETKSAIYGYNSASNYISNGFSSASANHGFNSCFTVQTPGTPKFIRIKAFEEDAYVNVFPSPGNVVPKQGILIESYGKAGDIVKKVTVLKSDPIAPAFFDYVLYQRSSDEPLSNMTY